MNDAISARVGTAHRIAQRSNRKFHQKRNLKRSRNVTGVDNFYRGAAGHRKAVVIKTCNGVYGFYGSVLRGLFGVIF